VLGSGARKYAHKIPFIVKFNHNELMTYPNKFDQIMFGSGQAGLRHGRAGGRRDDLLRQRREPRQIVESAEAFERPTSSAWRPCCGATCATTPSR
jgi:class I fructose-bisphosphate aldolase